MPRIVIKGFYTILGKIRASTDRVSVRVAIPDKPAISVDVIPEHNIVESFQEVVVSNEILKVMEADGYGNLSKELESELAELTSGVSQAARRVLNLIKYCFNQVDMDEQLMSVRDLLWSEDGTNWKRISGRLKVAVSISGTLDLNENSCRWIQDNIDSDYQPFLALRHLHRARKESIPRHKWIEATIAAELAIKEFLIMRKPDLSTLLLEVPSPPMHKMYGAILKEYTGDNLDKKIFKALVEGAEIRNRLQHRPQEEVIDLQKANDYVNAVSEAIGCLLSILYPKHHLVV